MPAGKRIIGGFFVLMMGLGVILDTTWDGLGTALATVGAGLMLWGAAARR